jgi:hypothetical protein
MKEQETNKCTSLRRCVLLRPRAGTTASFRTLPPGGWAGEAPDTNQPHPFANLTGMSRWVVYWNREVVGRWVAYLIGWWFYGTGVAVFLYGYWRP